MPKKRKIKICAFCKRKKLLSEFGKNKKSPDGLTYSCKVCTRLIDAKGYYARRKQILQKRKRQYQVNPEEAKSRAIKSMLLYPNKNRIRTNSRNLFWQGKVVKLKCAICDKDENLEFHHKNYINPEDVLCLCRNCHRAIHRKYHFV